MKGITSSGVINAERQKYFKVWYASKSLKWGERNGENRSVWHLNAVTPIMCIFKLFSHIYSWIVELWLARRKPSWYSSCAGAITVREWCCRLCKKQPPPLLHKQAVRLCSLIKQARGEKSIAAPRGSDSDHLAEHDIVWAGHDDERRMESVWCFSGTS